MMQQYIPQFVLTGKQKLLLMRVTLMMYLNQLILRLYQTYKNILEKLRAGFLIQSLITLLIFQSTISWLVAVISNGQKN